MSIMHLIQEKLLKLSKTENLARLSLRDMASKIELPYDSPQKIKHHLLQLQKKGFITINRNQGIMNKIGHTPTWAHGLLNKVSQLFSIPIIGTANCGPATIFAEENFQGFLKVSSKLLSKSKPTGLFAIKANGVSMNRANINGKSIENGDYVIIDSQDKTPNSGDIILAIIENNATIKRFVNDMQNKQIVLKADSSFDYMPIYLHPDDDFDINGKVIQVIKATK